MANLFVVENHVAKPNPECLLVNPFKEIWERDNTADKRVAIAEFSYIEFMSSMKDSNPFRDEEEDVKETRIIEEVKPSNDWKPDALLTQGVERMIEIQNTSLTYRFYMGCRSAAEKVILNWRGIDLSERTKAGMPVFKAKDVTSGLQDAEKILQTLSSLDKKVQQDLLEISKTRANKEISYFSRPESLENYD